MNQFFEDYFNHATQLITIIDQHGEVLEVNHAVLALIGLDKSLVIGQPIWELPCWLHSQEMQNTVLFSMEQSAITTENTRFAAQYKDLNDAIVDVDFVIKPVFDHNEQILYFVAMGYNISELVQARRALSDRERQMTALFENASEGFVFNMMPKSIEIERAQLSDIVDDLLNYQRITQYNKAFLNIYHWQPADLELSSSSKALLRLDDQSYRQILEQMITLGSATHEYGFFTPDHQPKTVEVHFSPIINDGYLYGNFCVIKDLTIQRRYERELKYHASKDFLTGLNNRRTFFNSADKSIVKDQATVIALFDIDHFKQVNDTYGHDIGDRVLKTFAQNLDNHFSHQGICARLGGEEFAVLFSAKDQQMAQLALDTFRQAYANTPHQTNDKHSFYSSVSIGAELVMGDDYCIENILKRADEALYQAKENGRNRLVWWNE